MPLMLSWPSKLQGEKLDYKLVWADRLLPGETIQESTWLLPDGMTLEIEGKSGTETVAWISGGTPGLNHITNRVTTSEGRIMEVVIVLNVEKY